MSISKYQQISPTLINRPQPGAVVSFQGISSHDIIGWHAYIAAEKIGHG
jgi:hypothetical protein